MYGNIVSKFKEQRLFSLYWYFEGCIGGRFGIFKEVSVEDISCSFHGLKYNLFFPAPQ